MTNTNNKNRNKKVKEGTSDNVNKYRSVKYLSE